MFIVDVVDYEDWKSRRLAKKPITNPFTFSDPYSSALIIIDVTCYITCMRILNIIKKSRLVFEFSVEVNVYLGTGKLH